jgi:RNA polymerase sigma factor (sigma-70 family)
MRISTMTAPPTNVVLRHIREVVAAQHHGQPPDAQLLQRFVTNHEEAAFARLVRRHGPLVLGVCRRVLHNLHDAEDAFQATFLILARRASSIHKQESLGSWLHGVAYRVALKARTRAVHRKQHELQDASGLVAAPLADVKGSELVEALDEELQHLPERLKAPLVLCYLEGRTRDEAAAQLGWSVSTLRRRLEQGRDLLRSRLVHRGLTLPAALLTAGMTASAETPAPVALVATTIRAGLEMAAGTAGAGVASAQAVRLAEGVLQSLSVSKLKAAVACLLLTSVAALGVAAFTSLANAQRQAIPTATAALRRAPAEAQKPPDSPEKAKALDGEQVTVTGQVLDAKGKPLAGANVAALVQTPRLHTGKDLLSTDLNEHLVGKGTTDKDGRYQLKFPRSAFKRSFPGVQSWVTVLGTAKGHAVGWGATQVKDGPVEIVVRLQKEEPVRGRLIDLQGEPAAGVQLHVVRVARKADGVYTGIQFPEKVTAAPFWPGPVTTDKEGRFVIPNVTRTMEVTAQVYDDRYALHDWKFTGDDKEVGLTLAPAHLLEGRVVRADNRKGVAGLTVVALALKQGGDGIWTPYPAHNAALQVRTDDQGHFRFNHYAAERYIFHTDDLVGEPYFALLGVDFHWPKGAKIKQTVELVLPRGILQRGKVVDADTGKPVAGARLEYFPQLFNNPAIKENLLDFFSRKRGRAKTRSDGTFEIAILPGPGHLLVNGPWGQEYVTFAMDHKELLGLEQGALPPEFYAHDFIKLSLRADVKPDFQPPPVTGKLRPGVRIEGRVLGPSGKPVASAQVVILSPSNDPSRQSQLRPVKVTQGQLELKGCDPNGRYLLVLADVKNHLGAVAEVTGKQAGKPVTVRLQACGSATARFVDAKGNPLVKYQPLLWIKGAVDERKGAAPMSQPVPGREGIPATDAQGVSTFANLVPGVRYVFRFRGKEGKESKEFTVTSGKTADLGDIVVAPSP